MRCKSRLDPVRIQIISPRIGFDGDWSCLRIRNGEPSGDKCVAGHDYLITTADPVAAKDEMQGIQTVPDTYTMIHAAVSSEFGLEGFYFLSQDIPS
jgi:hypothetical protein